MEALVFDALEGLVNGRVFPDIAPVQTPRPYITYAAVGGDALNYTDGAIPGKENARLQVNVWADTRLQASDVGRQVELALRSVAALQTTVLGARVATYDPDVNLRGTMQDFSIWF
jgi:hypothetical protein